MSLLPLIIAAILAHGDFGNGAPAAAAHARGKSRRRGASPAWPTPRHPPPPEIPPIPALPPMPAESPATPLADIHAQNVKESAQHANARALYGYVTGPAPNWGFPGRPSASIKKYQTGMGEIASDGIYGAKTKARGEAILEVPFPARPNAKSMATSAAKNKAKTLISKGVPHLHFP